MLLDMIILTSSILTIFVLNMVVLSKMKKEVRISYEDTSKALMSLTTQVEYYVILIRKRTTREHQRVNRLTRRVTQIEKLMYSESMKGVKSDKTS